MNIEVTTLPIGSFGSAPGVVGSHTGWSSWGGSASRALAISRTDAIFFSLRALRLFFKILLCTGFVLVPWTTAY